MSPVSVGSSSLSPPEEIYRAPKRAVGALLIISSALATAIAGVLAKEAFSRNSSPLSLLASRYVTAGVLAAPALLVPTWRPRPKNAKVLLTPLAVGTVLFVGGIAELEALARLPLPIVIVIVFVNPVWVAVFGRFAKRETIGRQRLAALGGVLAGTLLLVGPVLGAYDPLGLACALFASVIFAAFLLLIDVAIRTLSAPATMVIATLTGGVLALIADPGALGFELGDSQRMPFVLGLGVATSVSFFLLALGMRTSYVLDASVLAATEPLFTTILAALLLGEVLSVWQLVGATLVVIGVVIVAAANPAKTVRPPMPPA